MSALLTTEERGVLHSVVSSIAGRYQDWVDVEDVEQELMLWVVEYQAKIHEWRQRPTGSQSLLAKSLWDEARSHAEREKASQSGYAYGDNFTYNPGMLRILLPIALDEGWGSLTRVAIEGGGGKTPLPKVEITLDGERSYAHGGTIKGSVSYAKGSEPHSNLVNMLIDVRRGLLLVDEDTYGIIVAAVDVDWKYRDLAEVYDVHYRAAQKRVERALWKLSAALSDSAPPGKDSEEVLRRWQDQLYSVIPRRSDSNTIRNQEVMG